MPPLVYGLYLAAGSRSRQLWGAGLCVALACWWRLQVVSVLPGLLVALWPRRLGWRRWGALGLGLLSGLGLQAGIDGLTLGAPLAPIWRNLAINLQPHAQLSRSPPWGYVGLLLVLSLPPASLWLWPAMLRAARQVPLVGAPLLSFVCFHALVPHKEDRFLLPIVPLWGLLLAAVPSQLQQPWAPPWQPLQTWTRRHFRLGAHLTLAVAGLLLLLTVSSQSQRNLRDTMVLLRADPQAQGIVSLGPELQTFYLGRPELPSRQHDHPDEAWLLRSLAELQAQGAPPNRFVAYASDRQAAELWLRLVGFACQPPQQVDGWWGDRLLARLNPRRNRRRGPTLVYSCSAAAVEVAQRGVGRRATDAAPTAPAYLPGRVGMGAGKSGRASR